jgi:hypothetical protein|tara:strand:- start:1885 stop:2307 length:423 start_codon:yes stop_codon:yes gene_type:complete
MANRLPDWEERYHAFMIENKDRDFQWGEWDCVKFADAAFEAMTGEALIPPELEWHDEASANEAIKSYGKTLLKSLAKGTKLKGLKVIQKQYIAKGDIVVFEVDGKQVTGVCDGYAIISPSDGGYSFKDNDLAIKVFRING